MPLVIRRDVTQMIMSDKPFGNIVRCYTSHLYFGTLDEEHASKNQSNDSHDEIHPYDSPDPQFKFLDQ